MTKVTHTKKHNDKIVAEAKLVLVESYGESYTHHVLVSGKVFKPILISETEKIEVGDDLYHSFQPYVFKATNENRVIWGECYKILALPEHFSPEQLQMIVDGRLKDGDKVLVECERNKIYHAKRKEITEFQDSKGYYSWTNQIKLNPHITLYPVQEKLYTITEMQEYAFQMLEYFFDKSDSYSTEEQGRNKVKKWFEENVK